MQRILGAIGRLRIVADSVQRTLHLCLQGLRGGSGVTTSSVLSQHIFLSDGYLAVTWVKGYLTSLNYDKLAELVGRLIKLT